MARRTKPDAQATREHLLDTAEQVILARGLSRTSLQDIAQAAGLTRGAIYWHFADKVALFNAIMNRVDLPLEQALALARDGLRIAADRPVVGPAQAATDTSPDPLQALRTLALEPFALMQRDPRAWRAFTILLHRTEFVGELAPLASRQDDALHDCQGQMTQLFSVAAQQGLLVAGLAPRTAATALLALVDGLLRLCTQQADPAATQAVLPEVAPAVDALLRGMRATG
jgi:TetR/AcrR family transcriptional regulator, acrAB operon repressor